MPKCMDVAPRNAQLLPAVGGAYVEQVIWGNHTNGHTRYFWIQLYTELSLEMLLRASRLEQFAGLFGLPGDVQIASFVRKRPKAVSYAGVAGGSVRSSSSSSTSTKDTTLVAFSVKHMGREPYNASMFTLRIDSEATLHRIIAIL